jgi:hypothetical protein
MSKITIDTNFTKRTLLSLLFLTSTSTMQLSLANADESDGLDYQTIVSKYSKYEEVQTYKNSPSSMDKVKFHLGVGYINSIFSVRQSDKVLNSSPQGITATFGIDLFSDEWIAEGSFSNFGETRTEGYSLGLKAFDLKVIYQGKQNDVWQYKIGMGLAARYLKVENKAEAFEAREYSTPSSVLLAGADIFLSDKVSFGPEVSTRSSLVDESIDRSSFDLALKLNGKF